MARIAIILAVLAVVLNAQCFGACLAAPSQQSSSCPHHQKKTVERCDHTQLISNESTPSQGNPLVAIMSLIPALRAESTARPDTTPRPSSLSPPLHPAVTILKI